MRSLYYDDLFQECLKVLLGYFNYRRFEVVLLKFQLTFFDRFPEFYAKFIFIAGCIAVIPDHSYDCVVGSDLILYAENDRLTLVSLFLAEYFHEIECQLLQRIRVLEIFFLLQRLLRQNCVPEFLR